MRTLTPPPWLAAVALFACLIAPASAAEPSERPPNVIVIFTDDQGSIDAGCYGATDLKTPGIDALAKRGVRFTQFYAAAPVCSPSRAGLMTGRYNIRAGVPNNAPSTHGKAGMPTEMVTMAELLKSAGYATAHIGKWHLGYTPETMPNGQGFDYSFGHMGGCIDNYSHFFYWQGPNRHDLWRNGEEVHLPGRFFGDLMVEEAEKFITEHRDRPFFIYFALNMPHYPYQGDPEWLERYADVEHPRNLYNAFVSTLDARIARLTAVLDRLELADDTIVIFQSDHGHSTEERAHHGGGNAGPYRGAKFSMFEGGIRVPAIISWPGRLPEGVDRDQLGHGCDWFATVAELCGVDAPEDIDGKSLVGVIESAEADSPHEVTHWQIGRGDGAQWAVRRGPWKLMGNVRDTGEPERRLPLNDADQRLFLVNLDGDPGEKKNVAAEHPAIRDQLKKLHDDWAAANGG